MHEFIAALGLLQLRDVDVAIARRQEIEAAYRAADVERVTSLLRACAH